MTANRSDGLVGLVFGLVVIAAVNAAFAGAYVRLSGSDEPAIVPPDSGPQPPPPTVPWTVSVADAVVGTGVGIKGRAVFRVTLSRTAETDVTVEYRTEDGTAKAGIDYVATADRVVIGRGATQADVDVQPLPRRDAAPARSFALRLTAATPGEIGSPSVAHAKLPAVEGTTTRPVIVPPPTKPVPMPTKPELPTPTPTKPATKPTPPTRPIGTSPTLPPGPDWTKGDLLVLVVPTRLTAPGGKTWDQGRERERLNRQLATTAGQLKGRLIGGGVLAVWNDDKPPVPWTPDDAAGRQAFGDQSRAQATAALKAALAAVEQIRKDRPGKAFRAAIIWASEAEPGAMAGPVEGVSVFWYGRSEDSNALAGTFAAVTQLRDDEVGQTAEALADWSKGGE